ncbi:MAG TPA: glycosyltransferase family 4 protein [Stenomitos sp.]
MPSLLVVTTIPETIQAFLLPYVSYLRQQGWRVDGMSAGISDNSACTTAFDRVWDVEWSRNPLNLRNFTMALPRISATVEQEHYDLVHVHTPVAAFLTRLSLRGLRRKQGLGVIYTAHGFHFHAGGGVLQNWAYLALEKLAGQWTDRLVVINREDEAAALRHRLVPPDKVVYMPGIGIDLDYYAPERVSIDAVTHFRSGLGLDASASLFLAIAELTPRKRPQDILQAFAQLAHPSAHLAFAGGGPLLPQLVTLAKDLQIENRVHFLGFRSDIPVLIRAATAIILVSRQEGLPRSVMESLALEVPVIGSNIRGTRDLLQEGGGWLIAVGNVEDIAQRMAWILAHPQETQAEGRKGRQQMKTYDLQHLLALHQSLYLESIKPS